MLKALGRGLSNKEIAQSLHISVDTERKHMMSILSKLGVRSRLQALGGAPRLRRDTLAPPETGSYVGLARRASSILG